MRRALVVGGTGMLAPAVRGLAGQGWEVVLTSRRPWSPAVAAPGPGRVRWVAGQWSRPAAMAAALAEAGAGRAGLAVAWIHEPHREAVLRAVAPLLARRAGVVEVWASAEGDPLASLPQAVLGEHPTQRVVLGYMREAGRVRWLTHAEIGAGVLAAARAAAEGRAPAVHEVGILRPWPPR